MYCSDQQIRLIEFFNLFLCENRIRSFRPC